MPWRRPRCVRICSAAVARRCGAGRALAGAACTGTGGPGAGDGRRRSCVSAVVDQLALVGELAEVVRRHHRARGSYPLAEGRERPHLAGLRPWPLNGRGKTATTPLGGEPLRSRRPCRQVRGRTATPNRISFRLNSVGVITLLTAASCAFGQRRRLGAPTTAFPYFFVQQRKKHLASPPSA